MSAGPRLFISYSRVDQAFALKLAADLRARGFTVWIDQDAIPMGTTWDVQIEKGVGQSDYVLVILSPASAESSRVRDEVALAEDEGKAILPILYQPCKVPINLRRLHYADFNTNYEKGIERLVANMPSGQFTEDRASEQVEGNAKVRPLVSTSGAPAVSSIAPKSRLAQVAVMVAGAVLMAIVLAIVYNATSRSDEAGRQELGDKVRQVMPREETPPGSMASKWVPGLRHPKHPHVVMGLKKSQWLPEDGYAWVDSKATGDFRVKWVPGVRHRQHPYVITSETEGSWSPAPGYMWVNPGDPKDLRVRPLSPP